MQTLTDEQMNFIVENARNELAKRNYKDYIELVHNGNYTHFDHTLLICDYLQRIAEGEQLHLMIELPPRHGKQCADDTPVRTTKGWKRHGELKVGDFVYHISGQPVEVLWISDKSPSDWVVKFSTGEYIRCHARHEWTVYNRTTLEYETLETQQLFDLDFRDYAMPEVGDFNERYIVIESISHEPNGEQGHCITVDSQDGLYLVGKTLIPTHNSMTVTETFPSYYLGRNPSKRVITSAYSDGLARKFGRLNRNKFNEFSQKVFGVALSQDNSSTSEWGVSHYPGGMISTGIGGSITGQGADCFVAGTMIDTEIGKIDIKKLHQMKDKPSVLSYNHKKNKQEYKQIVASREVNKKSYHMTIRTQDDNIVTCTPDHPFYIEGDGYVPISKAKVSGKFLTSDNTYDTSEDFDIYTSDNTVFYDIQVEDNHNFYAGNLLVHNCMIIDDPIKNAKEAHSTTIRENIWNEWESTLSTRLHDGASVIVIMTRWHEDDLIGRLLDNSPYNWQRLRLPAIAEDDDDLLGRERGQALCPDLGYDEDWAKLKQIEVGSRTWASLYQQRPSPEQGSIFKREWFQYIDTPPARYDDMLMSWDMTFKDSDTSDYVVGQVWLRKGSEYYCIDQVRSQMDFTQSVQAVINLKNKYPNCRRILIEDKANGPAIINVLKKKVSGIIPIKPKESKESRAYAVTPFFEAGNVYFKRNVNQLNDLIEELASFPNSAHDDSVDALTQAINYFAQQPQSRVLNVNPW